MKTKKQYVAVINKPHELIAYDDSMAHQARQTMANQISGALNQVASQGYRLEQVVTINGVLLMVAGREIVDEPETPPPSSGTVQSHG